MGVQNPSYKKTVFMCPSVRLLLKRISATGLSTEKQSDQYISSNVDYAHTWLCPPRSGPSPHPHSHSCHHLVSRSICSLLSPDVGFDWDIGAIGGGVRGGGRDNGFGGGGGWPTFGGLVMETGVGISFLCGTGIASGCFG